MTDETSPDAAQPAPATAPVDAAPTPEPVTEPDPTVPASEPQSEPSDASTTSPPSEPASSPTVTSGGGGGGGGGGVVVTVQPGSTPEGGVLPAPAPAPETPAPEPTEAPVDPTPVAGPVPVTAAAAPVSALGTRAVTEEGDVTIPRTDDDVLAGQFATVVDGPYAGRYAVYVRTVSSAPDGYPETVLIKTRDDRDEFLTVEYAHLRPATSGGR